MENSLSTFCFSAGDVIKFIKVLDPSRAYGFDEIYIRMIGICAFSISKSLHILVKNCLETVINNKQSGFHPNVHQLFSIAHKVYKAFDKNYGLFEILRTHTIIFMR